jgi:hypothetical protein
MKTLRKSVLATLVALSIGITGAALAQGPGYGKGGCDPAVGAMGMPGGGGMHRGANVDARLGYIKNELKITAQQEGAWQVFETAVKTQRAQARGPVSAKTAPERADARVARLEQHLAGAKEIAQAVKDLYSKLTPEQKATADRVLMQGGRRAG